MPSRPGEDFSNDRVLSRRRLSPSKAPDLIDIMFRIRHHPIKGDRIRKGALSAFLVSQSLQIETGVEHCPLSFETSESIPQQWWERTSKCGL